jgi:hypothetical protein
MYDALDLRLLELADSMGAERATYPVSIPLTTLQKSNFFSNYPQFAIFQSHLKNDLDALAAVAAESSKPDSQMQFLKNAEAPRSMCRSAACLHLYPSYSNQTRNIADNVTVTTVGRIFRNESKGVRSWERLQEYSMRELIFLGEASWVKKQVMSCMEWTKILMQEWQICGSLQTANDPFFADNLATLQTFQRTQQTKFEARWLIPSTQNLISVASFNLHGTHFTKAYDIRSSADADFLSSGCVGFGYERLLYAVLSQYGLDEKNWPAKVRTFFQVS